MRRRWKACGGDFEVGDVLRWTEAAWHKGRRRRSKAVKVGTRAITAQVEAVDKRDFVSLLVLKSSATGGDYGVAVAALKEKSVIRRKRSTIARGGAEKLAETPKSRFLP